MSGSGRHRVGERKLRERKESGKERGTGRGKRRKREKGKKGRSEEGRTTGGQPAAVPVARGSANGQVGEEEKEDGDDVGDGGVIVG